MNKPFVTTHYPVRGQAPAESLSGIKGNYLHIATTFPSEGLGRATFEAYPDRLPAKDSRVHMGVYVPTIGGQPHPSRIHIQKNHIPTDAERVALEILLASENITWNLKDLGSVAVARVWGSLPTIECVAKDDSHILFPQVPAQALVLAGLRAIAEFHALNRAS